MQYFPSLLRGLKLGVDSLLHPATCILCSQYHELELPWICEACIHRLDLSFSTFVRELELVDEKFVFPVYSGWHFDEKIETVIHALKYDKHFSIGPFLGKKIAGNAEKLGLEFDGSLLVPVPLHAKRFKERGFNQSERIVQGMLMQNNKASLSICLKRVVYTQSQAVLSQTERLKNVFNAFSVEMNDKENLKNKRIYLIDDVLTTGATMCECCKVLYRAGATNIAGLTIATAR